MTMMKRAMAKLAIVAGLLLAGGVQSADSPRTAAATVATVRVTDAWARATPPGTPVGAGYLTLHNTGGQALTLLTASSPRAERVELHETRADARGLSTMRPVNALPLPAGAALSFDAGGRHLMLVGLKTPLVAGEKVPLTLQFEGLAPLQVQLDVRPLGTVAPAAAGHAHHAH